MARLGLLGRIILALVAVSLVPLLMLSRRLYTLDRDAMREQVQRTHAVAARATAARVEAYLASQARAAEALAGNRQLDDPTAPEAAALVGSTLEVTPEVLAVLLQASAGESLLRAQRPGEGPTVDALLAGFSESPALGRAAGRSWLLVAATRPDGGRVVVVAEAAPLAAALQPEEMGPQARLQLLDATGAVVLGAGGAEPPPAEVAQLARSRAVSGSQVVRLRDGSEVVAAVWPIAAAPWTVATLQPASIAEAVAEELRQRTLAAVGVALLLAAVLVLVAWRSLVRPLRGMLAAQAELGLARRAGGGGEVSQLQASFRELGARVREQRELGRVFLGRYQVLQVIGAGGMGTVFRGWDAKLQRLVALKTLHLGRALDADDRRRLVSGLLREAVSGARFNHSHIVAVYDLEQAGDDAYVAMELVDGESLERHLHGHQTLPAGQAAALGGAVASALAAAHAQGLVHRDIKPANVLLGYDGAIKVADFGIADFMGSLRQPGEGIFGTPGYLAPEALAGQGSAPASDVFALGVLLYTAIAGRRPFAGRDVKAVLQATVRCQPEPLAYLRPDVPFDLATLVEELLVRDPRLRPTAQQAADRLTEIARAMGARWRFAARPEGQAGEMAEITLPSCWVPTVKLDRGAA